MRKEILAGAAVLATALGCRMDMHDKSSTSTPFNGQSDVAGTYVAADSGTTLGKHWCYSGALVLDTTSHFGSVLTMCSDDGGGPVTEHIKGSYHLRTLSTRVKGQPRVIRRLNVVLVQDGIRSKKHTLRYDAGALRFEEPWWLGAGLRALEIPDPVLRKVADSQVGDSAAIPAVSSTSPAVTSRVIKKASARIPAAK